MQPHEREVFDADLLARVGALSDVLGLVLLGSSAERARADGWSDHDLWLVVAPGRAEHHRQDLTWLPGADRLAVVVRETEHGLAVVLAEGHVVELAVATLADLAVFRATQHRVVLDRGGVAEAVSAITVAPAPIRGDAAREAGLLLATLIVGVGRARRGEVVAAGTHVREHAVRRLVGALVLRSGRSDDPRLDPLDLVRRLEQVLPEQAGAIARAQALPVEDAARALLELAERELAPGWAQWPAAGAAAVRARLGW